MNNDFSDGCYVMLHIATGSTTSESDRQLSPIVTGTEKFELNDEIWIQRLNEQMARNIQTACRPQHYKIENSFYPDNHLYAFVRKTLQIEAPPNDEMNDLYSVAAFSRLIHPTSIGDRCCAKVMHFDQNDSQIVAVQSRGVSPDVIISDGQRDWLSENDGACLRELMPWLSKPMNERVGRAFWNHEYAMRTRFMDMRWPLVVSGLEALINTDERASAIQFKERVKLLSDEFRGNLSDSDLDHAWRLRSKIIHAEAFLNDLGNILPPSQHGDLYKKLEALLRMTIRRCLSDADFGSHFRNRDAITARWLLTTKIPQRAASKKQSQPRDS